MRPRSMMASSFITFVVAMTLANAAPAAIRRLPGQDEEKLNEGRARWLEQIHRAAPGTDWRAIEAANREQVRLQLAGANRPGGISSYWSELGTNGQTGRNWYVAGSVADPYTIYVGSALGGMWSGPAYGGSSWTPRTDQLGMGVHHIVVTPGSPENFVIADGFGMILTSSDGGGSWNTPSGLPDAIWTMRRLVQDPAAPARVYALVEGWIWTGSSWDHNWFLLRSEDSGVSFAKVYEVPLATKPDIWMNRLTGGRLYLAAGNGFYTSATHGSSFTLRSTLPASVGDEAVLAGSEANGDVKRYVALRDAGAWQLYASLDDGLTWTERAALPDCYGTMDACMSDSAQVLVGGVNCYRSTDGGTTFAPINQWYDYYGDPTYNLHADIFGIQSVMVPYSPSHPDNGGKAVLNAHGIFVQEVLYINSDGGSYFLYPWYSTPFNLTQFGMNNSQYYGIRTSGTDPGVISAGSQDQGYQTTDAPPAFTQQISGDYGHLTSARPTNDMTWSVYPGFMLLQTTESPANLEYPYPGTNFPSDPSTPWMPFILAHPDTANTVLFGGRYLWAIHRTAPLTYTYRIVHDFDAGDADAVGAVAIAPTDHHRWYVATYNGRLHVSNDAGATWTQAAVAGPNSHYFYGSDLIVSPTNSNVAYVGGAGYSNPAVFKTTNGGLTWTSYGAGLPSTLVHGLAFDDAIDQVVYAATEAGPFRCVSGLWQNLLTAFPGAPLTDYWDVESLPGHALVRFATYGRGIWDFHTASTTAVGEGVGVSRVRLAIGPNPSRVRATLSYAIPGEGHVRIEVFDVSGQRVATPLDQWRPAGRGDVVFEQRGSDGRPLPSGIYLVRLQAGQGRDVRKLLIAR